MNRDKFSLILDAYRANVRYQTTRLHDAIAAGDKKLVCRERIRLAEARSKVEQHVRKFGPRVTA